MKVLLITVLTLSSLSVFAQDFERGFNAGLKSCSEDNYFICTSDIPNSRLKIRSINRGIAIKKLYDYCLSPSASVYRRECERVIELDKVFCKKI